MFEVLFSLFYYKIQILQNMYLSPIIRKLYTFKILENTFYFIFSKH